MENNNQIAKQNHNQILEIIGNIPHLSDADRNELTKRVVSDDIDIKKSAFEKLEQSGIAQHDLIVVQSELSALNKKGMYMRAEQTIKTGSGHVKIEMKGGDTKLIIPVLIIIGIVVIAALAIVFWR